MSKSNKKTNKNVEDLLWRGRIQLGDEPGIYGDVQYAGFCIEFPIELHSFNSNSSGNVKFIVEAKEVKVYEGYSGHQVTVFSYKRDTINKNKWNKYEVIKKRLTNKNKGRLELPISGIIPLYTSLRIEVDSELPPGLIDEFIVHRIAISSKTHYGYLGFRFKE
jgi:hypothetical protein